MHPEERSPCRLPLFSPRGIPLRRETTAVSHIKQTVPLQEVSPRTLGEILGYVQRQKSSPTARRKLLSGKSWQELYNRAYYDDDPRAWSELLTALPGLFCGKQAPKTEEEQRLCRAFWERAITRREDRATGTPERAKEAEDWLKTVWVNVKEGKGRPVTATDRALNATYELCLQYVDRYRLSIKVKRSKTDRDEDIERSRWSETDEAEWKTLPGEVRKQVATLTPPEKQGLSGGRYFAVSTEQAAYILAGHLWELSPATIEKAVKNYRSTRRSQ